MSRVLLPQSERLYYEQPQSAVQFHRLWLVLNDIQQGLIGVYEAIDAIQAIVPAIPMVGTTKGDIIVWDGTGWVLLPVGTDRDLLGADSASASGLSYYTPADVIGAGLVANDTNTVDLTLLLNALTADVRMQMSITSDVNGVMLDGDAATPGNNYFYGTNGSGTKRFYPMGVLPVTTQTADYTLALSDRWSKILGDSATDLEFTIPANGSIAFPIGSVVWATAVDTGMVVFVPDGGVTFISPNGHTSTRTSGSTIRAWKTDTNTWVLGEDLGLALDPDARIFIETNEIIDPIAISGFNNLFLTLKADSIYTKILAFYPFWGGNPLVAKCNMVNPGTFDLTFVGSPTFSYNGVSFNGTTQYARTGIIPTADLTQDDTHLFVSRRNNTNAGVDVGTEAPGATGLLLAARTAGITVNIQYFFPNNYLTAASASAPGKWCATRTSNIVQKTWKDSVQQGATDVDAALGWANLTFELYIGGTNSSGAFANGCVCDHDCVTIGDGLTDTDVANLTTAINNFNTAVGR